jgi:NUMOD4 motif/HNH endonuclease
MTEQWLPVVGYEGRYEVSDHGLVRSIDRIIISRNPDRTYFRAGQILKAQVGARGYQTVSLSDGHCGRSRDVHRLVLETFVGSCPAGLEGCHNNGVHLDNRLTNLRWDTRSANNLDAVRHGTHSMARKTHCKRGHEFTPGNTRVLINRKTTRRSCRQCERIRMRRLRIHWRKQGAA